SSSVEVFLPEIDTQRTVLRNASYATYVNSGHLIFVRGTVLMVARFDVKRLQITAPPVPLVQDDVGFDYGGKTPQITISRKGTIIYIPRSEFRESELVWVDRQGIPESLDAHADVYESPRLSSDCRHIAITVWSQREFANQVYVHRLERGTPAPLTTKGENRYAHWSPDGTKVAFWSNRPEGAGVFCKVVGTSASAELLAHEPSLGVFLLPYSWSHNRNLLACTVLDPITREDIWIVDPNGDHEAKPLLGTEHREYNPTFSPDGRLLAYVSEESGQPEIYVWEYPDGGHWEMVSTDGGTGINPAWKRDGDGQELYYINDNQMMTVTVTSEPNFVVGAPEPLFKLPDGIVPGTYLGRNYDVSDDGRFLMMKWSDNTRERLIVVRNWFEELKRLAPLDRNR
ncbi:MAG: PD40 domain-containing protein, partial [Phycisphaerales bacterium]